MYSWNTAVFPDQDWHRGFTILKRQTVVTQVSKCWVLYCINIIDSSHRGAACPWLQTKCDRRPSFLFRYVLSPIMWIERNRTCFDPTQKQVSERSSDTCVSTGYKVGSPLSDSSQTRFRRREESVRHRLLRLPEVRCFHRRLCLMKHHGHLE